MTEPIPSSSTTIQIPLVAGLSALVDRADAELVSGFNWKLHRNGYVQAQRGKLYVLLHRLIIGAGSGELVDHINGDPLDNRSANLRVATSSQNSGNRGPDRRKSGTTSLHKGVSWSKGKKRWLANIHIDGKTRYLGRYVKEEDAARAYNAAALAYWGEFARLNDVPDRS